MSSSGGGVGWNKLDKQATVVFSRPSYGKHQLSLNEGSKIQIIGESSNQSGWYKVKYNNQIGIYPSNYVKIEDNNNNNSALAVVDSLERIEKQDKEKYRRALERRAPTALELMHCSSQNALANEILQVLREWSIELNKLKNDKSTRQEFLNVKRQMATLVGLRKQIIQLELSNYHHHHHHHQQQQQHQNSNINTNNNNNSHMNISGVNNIHHAKLKELSDKVISVIEEGSRQLNLDLIVRVESDGSSSSSSNNNNNNSSSATSANNNNNNPSASSNDNKKKNRGQRAHEDNTPIVDLYRQYQQTQRREMEVRLRRQLEQTLLQYQQQSNNNMIAAATAAATGTAGTNNNHPYHNNNNNNHNNNNHQVMNNNTSASSLEDKRTALIRRVIKNYDPTDRVQRVKHMYQLPENHNSNNNNSVAFLLDVKACLFTMGEPTELYFSLYNAQSREFITEEYMVELTALGMPKDERLIQNIRCMFTDISEYHYTSDLHMICRIYRKGKMTLDEKAIVSSSELIKKSKMSSSSSSSSSSDPNNIDVDDVEEETFYRRPFACAVLPLTPPIISQFLMEGKEFAPGNLALYYATNEQQFAKLHELIIHDAQYNYHSSGAHSGSGTGGDGMGVGGGMGGDEGGGGAMGGGGTGGGGMMGGDAGGNDGMGGGTGGADGTDYNDFHSHHFSHTMGGYEKLPHSRAIGIAVGITMYHGKTTAQIIDTTPQLKPGKTVCLVRPLHFPQVISPDERRNTLYITLANSQLNDGKNVKVSCRVILKSSAAASSDAGGPSTVRCIRRYAGLHKEPTHFYHSAVYYHVHNPCFNETLCIDLSPSQLEDAVLVFLFSNCNNTKQKSDRFAVGFLDVVDANSGVIIPNARDTRIELYKYSAKDMDKNLVLYAKDVSARKKLTALSASSNYLSIGTRLVSTRCTQDIHLNQLLKYSQQKQQIPLEALLNQFSYVSMQDVVKYIRDTADALFNILISRNDEKAAELVFASLLRIIDALSNKNFAHFRRSLDEYVDKYFNFPQPQIHKWFLHCLIHNLTWDESDKRKAKLVSQTLRAFHYMFRFIVASRSKCERQLAANNNNSNNNNFGDMMSSSEYMSQTELVFSLLNKVIAIQNNTSLIAAQDLMLKFIGPLFEVMSDIFPSGGNYILLGRITRQFMQSIPDTGRSNTTEGKLFIASCVASGNMLMRGEPRIELMSYLIGLIKHHMNRTNTERRMSVKVLANIVGTLQRILIEDSDNPHQKENTSNSLSVQTSVLNMFELLPVIHMALSELKKQSLEAKNRIVMNNSSNGSQLGTANNNNTHNNANNKMGANNGSAASPVPAAAIAAAPPSPTTPTAANPASNRSGSLNDDESFELNEELQKIEELRGELTSTILAMFYVMDYSMLSTVLSSSTSDKSQSIEQMFDILQDVIEYSPIPEYWIAFNVFCYHTIYRHFQHIVSYMQTHFLPNKTFQYPLWNRALSLAISFARTKFLQVQGYSLSKQTKILVHGDMRALMVKQLRELWESYTAEQQMNFVPHLLDPMLRLAATIPKKEINVDALNIYYRILQLEYQSTKQLRQCQGITGSILDEYIVKDQIDSTFKHFFEQVLAEKFQSDESLRVEGTKFLDNTKMLIDLIAAVQKYNDDQEDQKTTSLIKVMQYVATSDQQEIYFKYVHALADVHLHNENYVEAALALMLHADHLSFQSTNVLPPIGSLFPQEKERDRKIGLYMKALEYFDKGKDWERAIQLSRVLAPLFEKETFEYDKLAEMLRLQGELFLKIATQKRLYASYFYVAYYGKSFQEMGLRNKEFIYKGFEAERLMDFVERIMKRFPNAEMLKPMEPVSEEKMNGEGQYIQIMTVYSSCFADIHSRCAPRPRNELVSQNIAAYDILNNNVRVFMYSKTFLQKNANEGKPANDFRCMHTNFTFLEIGEENENTKNVFNPNQFPSIVRRKPILKKTEVLLTPVENAVKNILDRNSELMELVISHRLDKKPDTGKLSMSLNGIIDAAVNGGVNKYVDAFFCAEYVQENPKLLPLLQKLQKSLEEQLVALNLGLEMYHRYGSAQTRAHVEHLYSYYANMKDQLSSVTTKDLSYFLTDEYKKNPTTQQ